jgi:hypothetical protein
MNIKKSLIKTSNLDNRMVWSSWDGISYKRRFKKEIIYVRKDFQKFNPFCVVDEGIAYVSHSVVGEGINCISRTEKLVIVGKSSEISVELCDDGKMGCGCHSMFVCGRAILLNFYCLGKRNRVMKVDLNDRSCSYLEKADEVRCSNNVEIIARFFENSVYADTRLVRDFNEVENVIAWDYCFDCNTLVWTDGKKVVVENDKIIEFEDTFPFLLIRNVVLVPSLKQVWVSVDLPFTLGFKVLKFSLRGSLKGCAISSRMPLKPPFVTVDSELENLLHKKFNTFTFFESDGNG